MTISSELHTQIIEYMKVIHIPPTSKDIVFNDECVYSFDNRYSTEGIFVNLKTLEAAGIEFLALDSLKTKNNLYLNIKYTPEVKKLSEEESKEPVKLGINVEGGFSLESKYDTIKSYSIIVIQSLPSSTLPSPSNIPTFERIPYPSDDLPSYLSVVVDAIISHQGMNQQLEVSSWEAQEERPVSKYAKDLPQVLDYQDNLIESSTQDLVNFTLEEVPQPDGTIKMKRLIPMNPVHWRDDDLPITTNTSSFATQEALSNSNLWLNLSTGHIGGGRKNWDGSGGSGTALEHYKATGCRYPLVVKLGTINEFSAEVWSYASDEDCLVEVPNLDKYLSYWGIDRKKLVKTSRNLVEMEVEKNMKYDWSRICGEIPSLNNETAPPQYIHDKKGYRGLKNMGATCYMNAILQFLFSIKSFQERYNDNYYHIINSLSSPGIGFNFIAQLSKLFAAIHSDKYVDQYNKLAEKVGINGEDPVDCRFPAPRLLKAIIAKTNTEFAKPGQQDSSEFFTTLLEVLQKEERKEAHNLTPNNSNEPLLLLSSLFEFNLELKQTNCSIPNEVKFVPQGPSTLLNLIDLPVPIDKINENNGNGHDLKKKKEEDGTVTPIQSTQLSFYDCFDEWLQPEQLLLENPKTGTRTNFSQTKRFASFPPYLTFKLNRYMIDYTGGSTGQDFSKKIDVDVNMPFELDLSNYSAFGLSQGEEDVTHLNPPSSSNSSSPSFSQEELNMIDSLSNMGFSSNACKRAVKAVTSLDFDALVNWVLENPEIADLPFDEAPAKKEDDDSSLNEAIQSLSFLGYDAETCKAALIFSQGDVERAADWIFSNLDDLQGAVKKVLSEKESGKSSKSNSSEASSRPTYSLSETNSSSKSAKYELVCVVTHLGKNISSGHYFSHVKIDGEWIMFNDEKVAKVSSPPTSIGYIYFYKKIE